MTRLSRTRCQTVTARNRALIRTWQILQLLEHRGYTLRELADSFGVCTRTIRRDLEALQAAGFAIYDQAEAEINGGEGRWRILNWRKEAA